MTLKNFLLNYFSPWYFLLRIYFLVMAGVVWALGIGLLVGNAGLSPNTALYVANGLALVLVWNALRPWKIGVSYNTAKRGASIVIEKLKNQ